MIEKTKPSFQENLAFQAFCAEGAVAIIGSVLGNRLSEFGISFGNTAQANGVTEFITQHTGDWINAGIGVFLGEKVLKKVAPRASQGLRTLGSVVLTSSAILFAETVQMPRWTLFFGTADHADIPYGLLSVVTAALAGIGRVNYDVIDTIGSDMKHVRTKISRSLRRK